MPQDLDFDETSSIKSKEKEDSNLSIDGEDAKSARDSLPKSPSPSLAEGTRSERDAATDSRVPDDVEPTVKDEDEEEAEEESSRKAETPVELSSGALELKAALSKLNVSLPVIKIEPTEVFDAVDFPESYCQNTNKEKLINAFAENFRRQYIHLYRDRKPLLLSPANELGVEKFVCTTIRPAELEYHDLYDWRGSAEFVADYLNFVPLHPPHELPTRLLSPTTVLQLQKGNSFEYSTILASLLIGVGYDAYVVSGYASREVCLMDETREICPFAARKLEVEKPKKDEQPKKYTVRPPKDLTSRFERKQEEKRLKQIADDEAKMKKEEEERQLMLEQPPADPLNGLRVHSWVLVLEGRREVAEPFFIETLTGLPQTANSSDYHGIESVWNHRNYWANMQDCSEGVTKLKYDLGDCTQWEYMFPSNDKPQLVIPADDLMDSALDDEETNQEEIEKHLDLPPSWVKPICLTPTDFRKRCPLGKKTKLFKRTKLEKFAPYLMNDGLVARLSTYEDFELTILLEVKEFYNNRADKLKERHFNQVTGWVTEYFSPGRPKHLKEHQYKNIGGTVAETERVMTFYHAARVDGLEKRAEMPREMDEYFIHRSDFLLHRHVEFGTRQKKFGPAENTFRPIEKMIERYARDESKRAEDDVAELTYDVLEEKISITYHRGRSQIAASTREFMKPTSTEEKGSLANWSLNNHTTFQADPKNKDKKKVEIYQMMVQLMKDEVQCSDRVRESEREVQELLDDRVKEEVALEMEVSIYDTERNDKAKKHRIEIERQEMEEKLQRQEKELDYLTPFLIQLDNPAKITRHQAYKLREDCLADLKQRLIDKANLIQRRFEKETHELQRKQAWYQQNQVSMQKTDEQEYLNYCSAAMFRIHILELRLNRHKERAPLKYMELEHKIRSDARLTDYF